MPRVCPPGMVAVVQPGVTPRSGHENMYIAAQDDRQVHVEHVLLPKSTSRFSESKETVVEISLATAASIERR